PLAEVGQMLVVPRTHPFAERSRLRLADLRGVALVVPPAGRPHRQRIDAALRERAIEWEVAVEASGWALIIRLCSLGVGLAIVNDLCHLPRDLVGVPLPELGSITYHAVRRAGLTPSTGGAALWELLVG
ncbi:MAG: LysR family transcriptional regulator substrate-binding protein, partial [Nannocystaceae bacterium]